MRPIDPGNLFGPGRQTRRRVGQVRDAGQRHAERPQVSRVPSLAVNVERRLAEHMGHIRPGRPDCPTERCHGPAAQTPTGCCRGSYTQAVAPVSAEMACTAPTWSVPGASWLRHAMAYSRLASSSSRSSCSLSTYRAANGPVPPDRHGRRRNHPRLVSAFELQRVVGGESRLRRLAEPGFNETAAGYLAITALKRRSKSAISTPWYPRPARK